MVGVAVGVKVGVIVGVAVGRRRRGGSRILDEHRYAVRSVQFPTVFLSTDADNVTPGLLRLPDLGEFDERLGGVRGG